MYTKHISFSLALIMSLGGSMLYGMEEKLHISSERVREMCAQIYEKAKRDEFKPDALYGIARGGLAPLCYLAGEQMFDNRNVRTINVQSYNGQTQSELKLLAPVPTEGLGNPQTILLVDDLVDSGKSAAFVLTLLRSKFPDATIKLATLLRKPCSIIMPDYWAEKTELWVVFPWEK